MKKNRLLLDQKRFLSFSNYKNFIKHSLKGNNKAKIILNSNISTINFVLLNEIKKSQDVNIRNVSFLRNKDNKLFDNNIRLLAQCKNKSRMELSGSFILENPKSQRNNKEINKNIKEENFENINDILKQNSFQFHINKRLSRSLFEKSNSYRNGTGYKTIIKQKTYSRYNIFNKLMKYKRNDKTKPIFKTKSEFTKRKLSKDLFKDKINGIINKRSGKKKVKYKIIGTLTTEPNHKIPNKT